MRHDFTRTGNTFYPKASGFVGNGDMKCSRCWMNIPAMDGEVVEGWREYIKSDCDAEIIAEIMES